MKLMKEADDCALLLVYFATSSVWIVLIITMIQLERQRKVDRSKEFSRKALVARFHLLNPGNKTSFPLKVLPYFFVFVVFYAPFVVDIVVDHETFSTEKMIELGILFRIALDALLPFCTDQRLRQIKSGKALARSLVMKQAIAQYRGEFLTMETCAQHERLARKSRSNSFVAVVTLRKYGIVDAKTINRFSFYQLDDTVIRRPTL